MISERPPQSPQLDVAPEGPEIRIVSQNSFDFCYFVICNVELSGCGEAEDRIQMLMQFHGATVIRSRSLRVLVCLGAFGDRAQMPLLFLHFLCDRLPVINIEPAHEVALFNYPDAHERIRFHPELVTVSLRLAPDESTHVYREDSGAIQYPRPRSHSGIVQPQHSQE